MRPTRLQITEIYIFAFVLVIQSLPFLSAAGLAALEGRRINDFAFWAELQPRLVSAWRRAPALTAAQAPVLANAIVDVPAATTGEKQPEIVQ